MTTVQTPRWIWFQCFRCDQKRRIRLEEIHWDIIADVRCPGCGCTGTTHVVRVDCETAIAPMVAGIGAVGSPRQ